MGLPPGDAHQIRSVDAVAHAWRQGKRRIVLVLPTGGGKTWCGSKIVEGMIRKGRRVLWLARREELVDQAARSLARLGVDHGIIKAGRKSNPNAPIQVASAQTLISRPAELSPDKVNGIVDDETHHAVAATHRVLLESFPNLELLLGLTATPERGDRQPLGEKSGGIYQELVSVTSVAELQKTLRNGYPILVKCRVVGPHHYQKELWKPPIKGLLDHARDRRTGKMRATILFASSVEEAQKIAADANRHGIRAAAIDGDLAPEVRRARIDAFANGSLDLLTNKFVLAEGFDVPRTEVVAIARGCSASSTFLQMVGRALRASPDTDKQDALLIDFCGLSYVHGLVEEDRTYSLDGKAISRGAPIAIRQCLQCAAVFAPCDRCPGCGFLLPIQRIAAPKVKAAKTVEITKDNITPLWRKRQVFEDLCKQAAQARPPWKSTAIGMRFKGQFGHWPTWPLPKISKGAAA